MSYTPSAELIVPKLRASSIISMLKKGVRSFGRGLLDFRPLEIISGYVPNADGSALVRLGNTVAVAGVKLEVGSPYPDTPNEGALVVSAEFMPTASPTFEPGPPDENAIELARVIDRALRELKAIDLSKLVIIPGKRVWVVYVDIYILDHDGNLVDASSIASLAALMSAQVSRVEVDEMGNVKVDKSAKIGFLPLNHKVLTVSVAKADNVLFVDPDLDEESIADTKLIVAVSDDGRIAGLQKTGKGGLTETEVLNAIDIALRIGKDLIEQVNLKVVRTVGEKAVGSQLGLSSTTTT